MTDEKPPIWPEYSVPLDPSLEWTPIDRNAPIAYVRLIAVNYPGGVTQRRWEALRCPYCGDKHDHSAGDPSEDPRRFLGGRQSHCMEGDEYRLVEWTGQQLPTKQSIRAKSSLRNGSALSDRELRAEVWAKSHGHCWYCGAMTNPFDDFAIDHVMPVARGGGDEIDNLVPVCQRCNSKKRDRSLDYLRSSIPGGVFWFEREGKS